MSYTTQRGKGTDWEVRFAGKLVLTVFCEDVADDLAIALAAARREREKRRLVLQ